MIKCAEGTLQIGGTNLEILAEYAIIKIKIHAEYPEELINGIEALVGTFIKEEDLREEKKDEETDKQLKYVLDKIFNKKGEK